MANIKAVEQALAKTIGGTMFLTPPALALLSDLVNGIGVVSGGNGQPLPILQVAPVLSEISEALAGARAEAEEMVAEQRIHDAATSVRAAS